jgi:hypothetical protein
MSTETIKQMLQLLLTEPHAPTVCEKLERIAREALANHCEDNLHMVKQEQGEPVSADDFFKMIADKNPNPFPAYKRKPIDLTSAIEYADARWSGVDVPVEWLRHFVDGLGAQQRTWVGLTDEEIEDCYKQGGIGRAVQMMKEKNT